MVRAYAALKELRRTLDETSRIHSQQHQVDSSSGQEIGHPTPIQRPDTPALPKLITGCRLVLRDSTVDWIALPRDRAAYQRLTRLLTLGKRRADKGDCHLDLRDLVAGCAGMILIALPQDGVGGARQVSQHIEIVRRRFPGNVFLGGCTPL